MLVYFFAVVFFYVMKIELLMMISVKKRNKYLTWTYRKFHLCAESKLCCACALKNANDGTLALLQSTPRYQEL